MVLARELDLKQISAIRAHVQETTLEFFVHGALCVAYSGQCFISHAHTGRSASLHTLVDVGIGSFKIEGRYKDMATVKNVTARYRQLLDQLLEARPELTANNDGRWSKATSAPSTRPSMPASPWATWRSWGPSTSMSMPAAATPCSTTATPSPGGTCRANCKACR